MPIALGLGAVMALIAGTMLIRSHNDETSVVTRDAIAKSEAVAELAINRYKNLMNTYRDLATFPSCNNGNGSGTCDSESWQNAAAIIDDETAANLISSEVSGGWQDVSENAGDNPENIQDGQYRLIDYNYDEDKEIGILTVEGRVNQASDGTETAGTTTRRLRVTFPVTPTSNFFGLWLTCIRAGNPVAHIPFEPMPGDYYYKILRTNIRDTTVSTDCIFDHGDSYFSDMDESWTIDYMRNEYKGLQPSNTPAYIYETSNDSLPDLPPEGELEVAENLPENEVCRIEKAIKDSINLPQDAQSDPTLCANGPGTYYTYYFAFENFSLCFDDGIFLPDRQANQNPDGEEYCPSPGESRRLMVDAPGHTIKLYFKGDLIILGNGNYIELSQGTKLNIYAHKGLVIAGAHPEDDHSTIEGFLYGFGSIYNHGNADDLQIYVYPFLGNTDHYPAGVAVTLAPTSAHVNGGQKVKMFMLAPSRLLSTDTGDLRGAFWGWGFYQNIAGTFYGDGINCENLPGGYENSVRSACESIHQSNQIGDNISWEVVEVSK